MTKVLKVIQFDQCLVAVEIVKPEPQEVVSDLILDVLGAGFGHYRAYPLDECIILNQSF